MPVDDPTALHWPVVQEDIDFPQGNNTLIPLLQLGQSLWNAEVKTGTTQVSYDDNDDSSPPELVEWNVDRSQLLAYMFYAGSGKNNPCDESYDDPMDFLINSYREIALRMSIQAALENGTTQHVEYTSHQLQAQYAASATALTIAVVISLLGPLATLILFWNWWKLGRSFSMSPLELANAILGQELQSCAGTTTGNDHELKLSGMFADCSGNISADKLASHITKKAYKSEKETGEPMLQYGVLESTGRLAFAFANSGNVRKPKDGEEL